jgi:hypothetical protein
MLGATVFAWSESNGTKIPLSCSQPLYCDHPSCHA